MPEAGIYTRVPTPPSHTIVCKICVDKISVCFNLHLLMCINGILDPCCICIPRDSAKSDVRLVPFETTAFNFWFKKAVIHTVRMFSRKSCSQRKCPAVVWFIVKFWIVVFHCLLHDGNSLWVAEKWVICAFLAGGEGRKRRSEQTCNFSEYHSYCIW